MKSGSPFIEWVDTNSVIPNAKNRNKHSKEQIERLAKIIKANGWRHPIIVSNLSGQVVVGHGRLEAAKLLGEQKVPVHFQDFANKEEEFQFGIADNAIASWAELDFAGINADLPDMGPDFDLDLLGIKDFELEPADKYGDKDADNIPEQRRTDIVLGDLFSLGEHRLLCGDSTDKASVERLMNGEKADMVFTSPPYSDQRDYSGNLDLSTSKLSRIFDWQTKVFVVNLGYQRKDGAVYRYWDDWIKFAESRGHKLLSWNIWDRGECGSIASQNAMFGIVHEWVFVIGPKAFDLNLTVPNKNAGHFANHTSIRQKDGSVKKREDKVVRPFSQMKTVLSLGMEKARNHGFDHPAMFPVAFPEAYINAITSSGEIIGEPFCGSGSTLIACEKTNRKCYGSEIDASYCDVIIRRWEKFSGQTAYLIEDANGKLPNGPVPYAELSSMRSMTATDENKNTAESLVGRSAGVIVRKNAKAAEK